MKTSPLDSFKLWWRDIQYSKHQTHFLAGAAVIAVGISALIIFHPHSKAPVTLVAPKFMKMPEVTVDVAGEVNKPGVYKLPADSRVIDAIKLAGNAKPNADLTSVNLARPLKDGEQLYVDRKYLAVHPKVTHAISDGLININRASAKDLEKLKGIGPVLANRIIEYRKTNGPFMSVDDLRKVKGIGGSKFEKLKDKIRI